MYKTPLRMAFNNRNILLKMVEIQDIVLERKKHGVSQKFVYENEIFPRFRISYSTFNRYLGYPAKRELKEGRRLPRVEDKRQLSLF